MAASPLALIVEDDPDLGDIFSEALKAAGYETVTLSNGAQAAEWLKAGQPHLALLDLHLPEVTGAELLRQIRADERLEDTVVLVSTADGRQAEDLQDEADFCLVKPVAFGQLRDLAARLRGGVY